ncbi:outer membrane protein [Helicobacter felis]|uniref:outer membrane protein n=1 Tax=Helicobacter felis TaxID=214 RepID=UPI000CF079B0|nr:outer membrane protein [Helicobacter felis]
MRTRIILLAVLLESLSAESDGFYAQVGFQYSNITQDNATSKLGTQVVQAYQKVKLNQVFPVNNNWLAPDATNISFGNRNDNPAVNRIKNLHNLVVWDGKKDIGADKTGYEQAEQRLIPAWVFYTIGDAQAAMPNAPAQVVGSMLNNLGVMTRDVIESYTRFHFEQTPQLQSAFQAFEATSQQAAKALGMDAVGLSFPQEGNVSIPVLQTQISNLGNAANTLTSALFNALVSTSGGNLVIDNAGQRTNISQAIQLDSSKLSVLAQATQKVLAEYYQAHPELAKTYPSIIKKYLPTMQHSYTRSNLYGFNIQAGYKQFFGGAKRWGVRYYGSFSYNGGGQGKTNSMNNFVYGVGVDGLYNFFESGDHNTTSGLFLGLMLVGSSWGAKTAALKTIINTCNNSSACKLQMKQSYFQLPLTFGFRTNLGKHNGFEIGTRIPLLPMPNYYATAATNYREMGTYKQQIGFRRNASVYFNYVYNF